MVYFDFSANHDDNYWNAIYEEIKNCNHFILIIANDSDSSWAKKNSSVIKEIKKAINEKKHIVPLVFDCPDKNYEWPSSLPLSVTSIKDNQIQFLLPTNFDKDIEELNIRLQNHDKKDE